MEKYHLNTTQNVSLEFPIASIADRMVAFVLDIIILGLFNISLALILFAWLGIKVSGWMLLLIAPTLFYHLLCELFLNGQSLGKSIMKIRVFKADGSHLSPASCFIRWIFRLPDITLTSGALASLIIIINGKGQRLGDLAAATTVLKLEGKNLFKDTLWVDLEENYHPTFTEASLLTDQDVQIIKEVLSAISRSNAAPHAHQELLANTRKAIEAKTHTHSTLSHQQYLNTIVKDYNALHQTNQ